MEKKLISLNAKQNKKLKKIASKTKISQNEIIQRAIDAYDPDFPTEKELQPLLKLVNKSQEEAIEAVKKAAENLKETVEYFKKSPAERIKYEH